MVITKARPKIRGRVRERVVFETPEKYKKVLTLILVEKLKIIEIFEQQIIPALKARNISDSLTSR